MPPKHSEKLKTWDEWMPTIRLDIPIDEFRRLPRNPAYKYEYFSGHALLTPRPKHFHGVLAFADYRPPEPTDLDPQIGIRPMDEHDRESFPGLFAAAFHGVQPFGSLSDEERQQAARETLAKTYSGQDGPLIESACFTAIHVDDGKPLGAILITQTSGGEPGESGSKSGSGASPPWDHGQPHLTWIFVAPMFKAGGVGAALLARAIVELAEQGRGQLWTTFLLGNDSSMLWHWRNGFRLAPRRT